jgi:hypothetical protein
VILQKPRLLRALPSQRQQKTLNKKGCGECATAQNKQGTGKDLGSVYRRTPRRQFANCIRDKEDCVVHQERAPFFEICFY